MKRILLALLALVFLGSCCCGTKKNFRQTLRLNIPSEPATFDPRKGGDVVSSFFHFLLFEGLTRMNADGSTTPALAERIELSEDKLVYRFYLKDACWSDETAITAHDFEKSWKNILDPSFPSLNAHLFYPIKNAEKVKRGELPMTELGIYARDAKTFEVHLEHPTPYFLELISFCVFFPVPSNVDESNPHWAYRVPEPEQFLCSGPFILKKWKHQNEIVLVKNPHYWRNEKVQLEGISFAMVNNEMTALQMYERGELDMVGYPLASLPVDAIPKLVEKGLLHIRPTAATTFCAFNVEKPPFNNAKIRKAFSLAINRRDLVKNITQLNEPIATQAIPPILRKGKVLSFFKDGSIEEAQQLFEEGLEELGMTAEEFGEITLQYATSDANHQIVQAIQQQWINVLGVRVTLQSLEKKLLLNNLAKRNYQIAHALWAAQYNDVMNILERFKSKANVKNYPGWENAEFAQLLEESFYEEDLDKRLAVLEKAEQIFLEEMPIAPLYHVTAGFMTKPHIRNFGMGLLGNGYFEQITMNSEKALGGYEISAHQK